MQQFEKKAIVADPQIKSLLAKEGQNLDQIRLEVRKMVSKEFKYINDQAKKAHMLRDSVKRKWEPALKRAKSPKVRHPDAAKRSNRD